MLSFYRFLTGFSGSVFKKELKKRLARGKEDEKRLPERMGVPSRPRPDGNLVWIHAASVGEAQSALILMSALNKAQQNLNILITSGTKTSAKLMEMRLPENAIHQYIPLDHPAWIKQFLDHWKPQLVLWMESELWPNILLSLKERKIPAALVNARLSKKSYKRWCKAKKGANKLLSVFTLCLAQSQEDADHFTGLGCQNVKVLGNLKYSAALLPYKKEPFERINKALDNRPVWLYASTHDGEEDIACRLHMRLKEKFPNILTLIAPRHPERREDIKNTCANYELKTKTRSETQLVPAPDDDIYIIDTIGEMGLFYSLSPIACIGRSFSNDGGGGHNPIEAAQLNTAILHGPHVQNLSHIYEEMDKAGAIIKVKDEIDFHQRLEKLLSDEEGRSAMQHKAEQFVDAKSKIIDDVMNELSPLFETLK